MKSAQRTGFGILILCLIAAAAFWLGRYGFPSANPQTLQRMEAVEQTEAETESPDSTAVEITELVGPWHLAEGENDDAVIYETFPGAMEFGSSMEIRSDGRISWYIGADGASGTYVLSGNVLHAELTNDFDQTAMTMELTVEKKDDQLLLNMNYRDLSLCWSLGEGETGRGE